MKTRIAILSILCLSLLPGAAFAQATRDDAARDAVAFGSGVHVARGEVVRDAVAFGGDAVIEGEVLGDAVAFGGSVVLRDGASVSGDVTSFGGEVSDERAGRSGVQLFDGGDGASASHHDRGPIEAVWHWVKETARSAVAHALLFLLGLILMGVSRERLRAMQTTMITDGLKTAGAGLLGYVASVVLIVLLALTILGIPVAVLMGLALPVATYVGLAAAATVIGAALPLPQLEGNQVAQLAAGVLVLFVASLVPVVGGIATAVAACLGFGALIRTRFREVPPADLPQGPGPFPTPSVA